VDEGALLGDWFPDVEEVGGMALLAEGPGTALPRELVPFVHEVVRYSLKTRLGLERMKALGEGLSHGRRVSTGRHAQGNTARTARLTTEVVEIPGLTTDDP
jgi:hypothetical protein